MKFTKLALTILCSTLLFCGCAKNPNVAIKVNDTEITKTHFYSDFNRIKNAQFKNAPKEMQRNNSYAMLALKDRYTNDVIVRALLTQEFDKRKIEASDKGIEEKIEQVTKQIGSKEQFDKILKENNITQEMLHKDMAEEVKMEKLVNQVVNVKVSDKEAADYYNKNKEQFNTPERVQVSHILIDTNPENIKRQIVDEDKKAQLSSANIDEKVKAEVEKRQALAKSVLAKAQKNPNSFASLAKEYSQDPESAKKGGDLGYITKEQMVKEFSDAAFSQKVGVVGPLVKTQFGEHIILVKDKAKAGIQPFAKLKGDIIAYLTQQKRIQGVQKYVEGLKNSATIVYYDKSLEPSALKKEMDAALEREIAKSKKQEKPQPKDKK